MRSFFSPLRRRLTSQIKCLRYRRCASVDLREETVTSNLFNQNVFFVNFTSVGAHSQEHRPAAKRGNCRTAASVLTVLCLLLLAGVIVLSKLCEDFVFILMSHKNLKLQSVGLIGHHCPPSFFFHQIFQKFLKPPSSVRRRSRGVATT